MTEFPMLSSNSHQPRLRIYLIAGEPSGDFLGAQLMAAIRATAPKAVEFIGVGGPLMAAQGLASRFDYTELTLLGAAELLPHLPLIFRRIRETVDDIAEIEPDVVVTIDSPGFCKRVARRVRAARRFAGAKPALVHMVAPSVWAYKPQRAEEFASIYDLLLALLPFEPPHFEASGLPCEFIGNPVAWVWRERGDGEAFRQANDIAADTKLLGVFLGSRRGEIERHWPLFRQAVVQLAPHVPGLTCLLPVPPSRRAQLEQLMAQEPWPTPYVLSDPITEKKDSFAALDAALAKSGTVTLELALARVPMIVAYRVMALTAWLVRRWIRIPYVSLPNILSERMIVPELLQEDCTPEKLCEALLPLLQDPHAAEAQRKDLTTATQKLLPPKGYNPSVLAARHVLGLIS